MPPFDLIVIGAGPGGYVCALRAAQLGLKVALIDKRAALGGTCLNIGCIPSKALLHATEHYAWARHHAADSGLRFTGLEFDLPTLMRKKDAIVAKLTGGVGLLTKGRHITVLTGTATFVSPDAIEVTTPTGGPQRLTAPHFVIATGSAPAALPTLPFNGTTVISSEEALSLPAVPRRLAVVGGGAIGLELGSVWARLGADVTIVEFLPKIAATFDDDLVRSYTRLLRQQGLKIETGARVTGYADGVLTAERGDTRLAVEADVVLVAVGRRPYTAALGLDRAGVALDPQGRVAVDARLRTNVPHIRALGDVVAGPMLAHKAEEDGVAVAEWIAGQAGHVNWDLVPAIIYTSPEAAAVGLGEDAAQAQGRAVHVGRFNFAANGRALAAGVAEGFVKLIADAQTDRLLGAQILGHHAGELISEVVTHLEYGGSAEDVARTIHAHPTMSEAVKEAALAVGHRALHAL